MFNVPSCSIMFHWEAPGLSSKESAVDGGVLFEIMNGPTSGQVPDHSVHGMYVHAAAKCLLRGRRYHGGRGHKLNDRLPVCMWICIV